MILTGSCGYINEVKQTTNVFQNVTVDHTNGVATLTEVSFKITYERFAATKRNCLNNKMTMHITQVAIRRVPLHKSFHKNLLQKLMMGAQT